jgi:CheY-like chemotaxis protein
LLFIGFAFCDEASKSHARWPGVAQAQYRFTTGRIRKENHERPTGRIREAMWNRQQLASLFGFRQNRQLSLLTFELLTAGSAPGSSVTPGVVGFSKNTDRLACYLLHCRVRRRAGRLRICIIDDEPIVVQTLSAYLADLGHSVISYGSRDELDAAPGDPAVDLVIADLRLPGLNGMKLIRRVNRLFHDAPIVAVSGHRADETSMRDVIENEAYAFLRKPFGLEELDSLLARLEKERAD